MTGREGLLDRIRRETEEESEQILGELARLMSPALRSRAEQLASVAKALDLPLPAPVAWVLDLPADTRPRITVELDEGGEREAEAAPAPTPTPKLEAAPAPTPTPKPIPARPAPTPTSTPKPKPTGSNHPGIEGVPEELRHLPAAQNNGPLPQRIAAARNQRDALDGLREMGTATAVELGRRINQKSATAGRYMAELGRVGLVTYAGTQRGSAPAYKVGDGTPIPTELSPQQRAMPHAKDLAFANQWVMTLEMLRVLEYLSHVKGTVVIAELEGKIGDMPRSRINDYLSSLAEQGKFVKRVGYRRAKGQTAGRTAVEYQFIGMPEGAAELVSAVDGTTMLPPTPARPRAAGQGATDDASVSSGERHPTPASGATASTRGSAPVELDLKGAELLSKHRDYAVSMKGKGPFTPLACADHLGVPVAVSEAMLSLLAEQTRGAVVIDVGAPGITAYEYNETKGMGAAAQRDREASRARSHAAAGNGAGGGDPVAGTGWDPKSFSPDKEVQRRLRMAAHKWGQEAITKRGSSHIMIRTPTGNVTVGSTPNKAGLRQDGKLLERAGLRGALS